MAMQYRYDEPPRKRRIVTKIDLGDMIVTVESRKILDDDFCDAIRAIVRSAAEQLTEVRG